MIKYINAIVIISLGLASTGWAGPNSYAQQFQNRNNNRSIPNPSAEQPLNSNWRILNYGRNTPNGLIQRTGGYQGMGFYRLKVSDRVSGDARWQFQPITIKGSTNYQISMAYRNTGAGAFMVNYQDDRGNQYWDWLASTTNARGWKYFTASYTTKSNARNLNFYLAALENGTFDTDSYEIKESGQSTPPTDPKPVNPTPPLPVNDPAPTNPIPNNPVIPNNPTPPPVQDLTKLKRGLVSVEFDDGWLSAYNNGLPVANKYGIKTTQYIISDYTKNGYTDYMNSNHVLEWKRQGHFIGSHSSTHPDLSSLQVGTLDSELRSAKEYLSALLGEEVLGFVTPYCSSSSLVENVAKQYYKYSRDCDSTNYLNSKANFNPYHLTSKIVEKGATTAQINQWLTEAQSQGKWLILVYHRIDDTNTTWSTTPSVLDEHMRTVKNHGITILPTMQAFDEIKAQL
ncbi:MAG: polysaccharide deacetylase family protein [Patescibacteria group bacterium]